jgi:hypothetical protein
MGRRLSGGDGALDPVGNVSRGEDAAYGDLVDQESPPEKSAHRLDVLIIAPPQLAPELPPGVEVGDRVEQIGRVVDVPGRRELTQLVELLGHAPERFASEGHPVPPRCTEGIVLLTTQEHAGDGRNLRPELRVEPHRPLQQLSRVLRRVDVRQELVQFKGLIHLPDESEKQASPIAEVQIEGLARDAGALGQLLQAKAGTALNQ